MEVRPDDDDFISGVAADRDGKAKIIASRAIGSDEFGLLDPGRAGLTVDVRRARVRAVIVVMIRPDDDDFISGVTADRDGLSEIVARRAIGSEEFSLFHPTHTIEAVDVRRAEVRVVLIRPDNGDFISGGAADRDGSAKAVE